jgi:hypothetical protein
MRDADDPRRKAQLYRQLASIPTEGGHAADRALQVLAAKLEREGIKDPTGVNIDPASGGADAPPAGPEGPGTS